jgi:predicted RND superfamily exporter protein/CRP-like cAMP-binding protein
MRWLSPLWERPGWILAGVLGLSLFTLAGLVDTRTGKLRVMMDPSVDRLLPAGGRDREVYEHARKLFGSDEAVVVALGTEDVFTPSMLERIVRLTRELEALEGVQRVLSLATALNIHNAEGDLRIAPFLDSIPQDAAALERLRAQATRSSIYGGELVSTDGRTTALLVYLDRMSDRDLIESGVVPRIEGTVRAVVDNGEVWFSGPPYMKARGSEILLHELSFMLPLIIVALAFILFVSLRSLRGVLVPLAAIVVALLWTVGTLAWLGQTFDLVTSAVPALVLTVGFSYAIHVVASFHADFEGDDPPEGGRQAVRRTLAHVALPILVTAITTGAGFLALALNPIVSVQLFGLFSMLGVFYAVLATLTLSPALLALLPPPRASRAPALAAGLDRLSGFLARHAVDRRGRQFAIWGAVLVLALLASTQIRVGTEVMTGFHEDLPLRQSYEAINARLGGANELQILLESDVTEAFLIPANLAQLEALQTWLEEQPEIGSVQSIVDYLKLLNHTLHDDDPAYLRLPETRGLVTELMFFGASPETQRFLDARSQTANIRIRAKVGDTDSIGDLVSRIQARLAALPPHLRGQVTGSIAMLSSSVNDVARGQRLSLALAFGLIFLVLALTFTSVRVGLIALLPNALPIVVYFGALGLTGVTLNATTSLVGCLALGIAVDDTIHFFVRFNGAARRLGDETRAAAVALRELIRPVSFTTLGLCIGFLVLTLSQIRGQVEFGLLAAFTLAVAWLVDVTLTPALCSRLRIVTLWDLLTTDIGREPHRSIEIFDGLSATRARIVALMGRLIDAPAGQSVFHAGEPGSGLFVVISGEVRTWVSRREGEVTLGRYKRGECIGEVGFFQGEHSVHCVVEQDARMLRISAECLEALGRRYPRAAATLQGNLNKILAARLGLRTRESALDDAFFRVPAILRPGADGGPGADLVLDPSLTERLAGLGIRTETLAALTLIPLVRVAWADEQLDAEERSAVLRGAESVGIAQDSPGHELLRAWLEERPDPKIFEAWRDFVAALCARLSIEGQLELREDLLGRAREVAAAAGGFLGVRSISRREEAVLRELESVFPV